MNTRNHIPPTVSASLEARLAPFGHTGHTTPERRENLGVESSRAVALQPEKSLPLGASLKLLFAALGAVGSVVPLGDNGRTAHLLSQYAASLRDR